MCPQYMNAAVVQLLQILQDDHCSSLPPTVTLPTQRHSGNGFPRKGRIAAAAAATTTGGVLVFAAVAVVDDGGATPRSSVVTWWGWQGEAPT